MDIHGIAVYLKAHWFDLLLLPGNIMAVDAIVKEAAEKRGYKKLASLCDVIGNFLSFIVDIITGLLSRKQNNQTQPPEVKP